MGSPRSGVSLFNSPLFLFPLLPEKKGNFWSLAFQFGLRRLKQSVRELTSVTRTVVRVVLNRLKNGKVFSWGVFYIGFSIKKIHVSSVIAIYCTKGQAISI